MTAKKRKPILCEYCNENHLGVSVYCEKYPHSDECKCKECMDDRKKFRKREIMNDKLLPCPFCGGEAEILYEGITSSGSYKPLNKSTYLLVHCIDCQVRTCTFSNVKIAIEAWNTRISESEE